MRVLVTGGAGYIGSHTAKALAKVGCEPVVFDNLSEGHRGAVKWGPLVEGQLSDRGRLRQTIRNFRIRAAIHFAAHAYVGESMRDPRRYFRNNVSNTLTLLDALLDAGVKLFVFSSSCAVYGTPVVTPIAERHPKCPVNPYGESKLFIERVLEWYRAAYGLRSACLRYFNAAGADPDGDLGECHEPETHLIPLAIRTALGLQSHVEIFGADYPTPDGSAVRDFVHVSDLAEAHVLALQHLLRGADSFAANLGTGRGISVLEVIRAVESVAQVRIATRRCPRRSGDPATLVADPSLASSLLGWRPRLSAFEDIVSTAWRWHQSHALREEHEADRALTRAAFAGNPSRESLP